MNIIHHVIKFPIIQLAYRLQKMKSDHQHSLNQLQNLCSKITSIKESGKCDKLSEDLTQLYKLLVWGDRHDSDFFQYFFQIKALDRLLEIFSKATSNQVVIAIISFFNNLIPNVTRTQNMNFLLSHPCILSLQNIKFLSLNNQIAQYYINFLCILSQKIDLNTLHMFFNRRYPAFPLLMQTTRFYNHPESLVRAKCRSILLSCVKINSPKIRQFSIGFPFVIYYLHECNLLKQYWFVIDKILELQGEKDLQLNNLQTIYEDQKQLIMIIDDFMKIDPIKIGYTFVNAFANQCMAPLLLDLYSDKKINFNLKVVLVVCSLLISNIHNQLFLDFVIFCLFSKYYSSTICVKLMHPIEKPLSYSKIWKFKGFWDSYQNNINEYCVPTYFSNQKKIVSDVYADNQEAKKTNGSQIQYTKEMKSIFGMGTNFYDRETQKIEQIFAIPIHTNPENFQRKSFSQIFQQFKIKIKQDCLNLNELEENPVREPLLSFLKSKDDNLVFLTLHLIDNVINNKYVSPQILDFVALSVKPKSFEFKSLFDIEKIMKCCYCIMAVEPPAFRICTLKEAAGVVNKLSQIYKGNSQKIPEDLIQLARSALKQSVQRLNQYIYAGKDWQKSLYIFNTVSLENERFRKKDLYTFGLLEKDSTEINMLAAHEIYNIQAKYPDQIVGRDFWIYIIVRDSYCQLFGIDPKYQVVSCDEKAEKNASNFQIGSYYQIQSDHETQAMFRQTSQKNFIPCSLIFLGGYLAIGVDKIIRYRSSYQECLMVMDKSDPSKIMLEINKRVLLIQVQNAKKAYEMRRHFQQMKTLMFKYQLSLLVKQTEWMLEHANSSGHPKNK